MGDVVENGINGFLVDPRVEEIVAKILALLDSPDLRKNLGERGRELAQQRFSVAAMIKRHEEIYSQAIQNSHEQIPTEIGDT
jgi:glycosyltransferase involved in cell wall biosynthesis